MAASFLAEAQNHPFLFWFNGQSAVRRFGGGAQSRLLTVDKRFKRGFGCMVRELLAWPVPGSPTALDILPQTVADLHDRHTKRAIETGPRQSQGQLVSDLFLQTVAQTFLLFLRQHNGPDRG